MAHFGEAGSGEDQEAGQEPGGEEQRLHLLVSPCGRESAREARMTNTPTYLSRKAM